MTARRGQRFSYPADLAALVKARLKEMRAHAPALAAIKEMIEVAFFASLKTEEAEPVRCTLAYVDMRNPDPNPPERRVADRWSYTRFERPIPLDVRGLVKISKSVDSAYGTLAVDKDADGRLAIWGAIDQQGQRAAFVAREADIGPESPGLVQISISGVGAVEVHRGYTLLGALNKGHLTSGMNDVLRKAGPIASILQVAIGELVDRVKSEVGSDVFDLRDHWAQSITGHWIQALARILLGMHRYAHGGAVLLTPDERSTDLDVKYRISYDRLRESLFRSAVHTIKRCHSEDQIIEDFLDAYEEMMPVGLHLGYEVSRNNEEETRDELTGCVRFIASLSRVDGLVLMNRHLGVRGYGAIVTVKRQPRRVCLAGDAAASTGKLQVFDPADYGTRHGSMMRICFARPGSIGFVVSQDGDVRAMTRVGDDIIVWEDVKLRLA